jgi:uncharacterized alkaline shock family protein YloU
MTMRTKQRGGLAAIADEWSPGALSDEQAEGVGRVRIARRVLRTVVREAAMSVPGVARVESDAAVAWAAGLKRPRPADGVGLSVHQDVVGIDLYLVVAYGVNMVVVGEAVQAAIIAAIEHIVGMTVSEVNVFIRDVA